jgi:hypothetical protein
LGLVIFDHHTRCVVSFSSKRKIFVYV